MLNQCSFAGRLVKDPELRNTQSGTPVASFTLAVNRDTGDKNSPADFIDCIAWNKTAEFVQKYFAKGDLMIAAGRMQTRTWEDNTATKHKAVELNCVAVYFGSSKSNPQYQSGGAPSNHGQRQSGNSRARSNNAVSDNRTYKAKPASPKYTQPYDTMDIYDDDCPF